MIVATKSAIYNKINQIFLCAQIQMNCESRSQPFVKGSQQEKMEQEENKDLRLVYEFTLEGIVDCRCLCFNKENNILAVGFNNDIKIFQFENGTIKSLFLLKAHKISVNAIYIGNKNEIISCSNDKTIKIWIQFNNQEWKLHQQLKEHSNQVYCIVVNKVEDQLMAGSADNSVKCWRKTKEIWKLFQTLYHNNSVMALSLNESQNQLLSFELDKLINIFQNDSIKQWQLIQIIKTDDYFLRASFILDNMIAVQFQTTGMLRIYENDQNQFIKKQDIKVKGSGGCQHFFPLVFCRKRDMLVCKNCKFINIFKIQKDNTLVVEYEIEFKTNQFYGAITEDGKYLVTWDNDSKHIQVRLLN